MADSENAGGPSLNDPVVDASLELPFTPARRFAIVPHAPVVLTLLTLDFLAPAGLILVNEAGGYAALAATPLVLGVGLGQFLLLSIWAALGPEPWWIRLPAIVLVAALAVAAVMLGSQSIIHGTDPVLPEIISPALMAPLLLAAAQSPAWLVGLFLRRRIQFPGDEFRETAPPHRQYRLAHLLATMAIIAIVLSATRAALVREWDSRPQHEAWLIVVIVYALVATVSAVYTLPAIWIGVGAKDPWLPGVATSVVVFTVCGVLAAASVAVAGAEAIYPTFLLAAFFHIGLFAALLGGLLPFRAYGFALRCLPAGPHNDASG